MAQRNQLRHQDAKRGAKRSAAVPQLDLTWAYPDPATVRRHDRTIWMDQYRLICRWDDASGQLVEFALMLQVWDDDDWRDVVRVDSCDEEVHRHQMFADRDVAEARHFIERLTTQERLKVLSKDATTDLTDPAHVEEYVRRWRYGR